MVAQQVGEQAFGAAAKALIAGVGLDRWMAEATALGDRAATDHTPEAPSSEERRDWKVEFAGE